MKRTFVNPRELSVAGSAGVEGRGVTEGVLSAVVVADEAAVGAWSCGFLDAGLLRLGGGAPEGDWLDCIVRERLGEVWSKASSARDFFEAKSRAGWRAGRASSTPTTTTTMDMAQSISSSSEGSFILVDTPTDSLASSRPVLQHPWEVDSLAPYFASLQDPQHDVYSYEHIQLLKRTRAQQPDGRLFVDELLALLEMDGRCGLPWARTRADHGRNDYQDHHAIHVTLPPSSRRSSSNCCPPRMASSRAIASSSTSASPSRRSPPPTAPFPASTCTTCSSQSGS